MTDSTPAVPTSDRTSLDVVATERFTDDDMRALTTFDDAFKLLQESGNTPEDFARVYGTGFEVLDTKDKGQLVGVEFAAVEWSFNTGDNGPFTSIALMTSTGRKLILNDGSSGVYEQIVAVTRSRIEKGATPDQAVKGLYVKNGLRRSTYSTGADGKPLTREQLAAGVKAEGTGETFYLAN